MSENKLNVAFMGTGKIAGTVAPTVAVMPQINLYAVGSRSTEKANEFASRFGFEKSYGSYEEMLCDKNIQLVYIATPHALHSRHIKMCIDAGKNILCEKAFTLTYNEAKEVFDYAREKGVYIAEAIWCRYSPMAKTIKSYLSKLGEIHHVTASLSYPVWERERVHKLELGGGALLDVGIYPLNFIDLVLGHDIKSLRTDAVVDETEKTDRRETVTMLYKNGKTATFYSSITDFSDRRGVIYGENGCIVIENVNNYESLSFYDGASRSLVEKIDAPAQISGYEYEFLEAKRCIDNNMTESPLAPWSQTMSLLKITDYIRHEIGVLYPCENKHEREL